MKAIFTRMPSGDPELLSLKAINRLNRADLVVSCPQIRKEILEFVREGCRFSAEPEEIPATLSSRCRNDGFLLVRIVPEDAVNTEALLNEVAFFERAGFETEIIPSVSSIQVLSASRGFPLTNRNTAHSFWVADGKRGPSAPSFYSELRNAAASGATLVLRNASFLDDEALAIVDAVQKDDRWVLKNESDDLLIITRRPGPSDPRRSCPEKSSYATGGVFSSSSA